MSINKRKKKDFYKCIVLAFVFLILSLGYSIRNTFSVFYPAIIEELKFSRADTAIMFSISIIMYGFMAPLSGGLVDSYGAKKIIPIGVIIMGSSYALCRYANTQIQFYILYGISSVGLSLIGWTPISTYISHLFTKTRGLAFGILNSSFGASILLAYFAQVLILNYGWRNAYTFMGIFFIIFIVPISMIILKENHKKIKESKLNKENKVKTNNVEINYFDKSKFNFLKTYQFWFFFFIAFLTLGIAEQIIIVHQVYFLKDMGFNPMFSAKIYSIFGLTFIFGSLWTFLSDYYGREKIFIVACSVCIIGVMLLVLIKKPEQIMLPILSSILLGCGVGILSPVLFATIADLFHGQHFGLIQGTVFVGFSVGGAVGPWFAGFIHDKLNSYNIAFFIVVASLLLSAFLMHLCINFHLRHKYY